MFRQIPAITSAGLESSLVKTSALISSLALGAAAALALTSCSASDEASQPKRGDHLKVVVTTTQLADFAAEVGGNDIELTGMLAPGSSAHHFDPTPADLLSLGQADVLIVNGAGLDEFIDSAIDASGFSGTLVDASAGLDLETARAITAETLEGQNHEGEHEHIDTHGHSHGGAEGAAEPQSADSEGSESSETSEEDHDHDHDHEHGDLNPHLWTSPRFAQGMVQQIADELAKIDPEHGDGYYERAGAYNAKLVTLDEWIAAQFARVPAADRVLVTGHDSLRYYLHDYGIAYAGSLLPSFEDNAEPSAAEIDSLVAAIKNSGVKAIFVESSLSPKLAKTVAQEAGVAVIDEDSLYVDSLGPDGSGAETYISASLHNTRVILEAWGASIDPVPSALEGA